MSGWETQFFASRGGVLYESSCSWRTVSTWNLSRSSSPRNRPVTGVRGTMTRNKINRTCWLRLHSGDGEPAELACTRSGAVRRGVPRRWRGRRGQPRQRMDCVRFQKESPPRRLQEGRWGRTGLRAQGWRASKERLHAVWGSPPSLNGRAESSYVTSKEDKGHGTSTGSPTLQRRLMGVYPVPRLWQTSVVPAGRWVDRTGLVPLRPSERF